VNITVCIATVRPDTLGAAIGSVRRQTWQDWELLVIAQGGDPRLRATCEAASAGDTRVRFVAVDTTGLSRARNTAIRLARGDVLAMTDDDCEAREDWLAAIAAEFRAYPRAVAVGGSLVAPPAARTGPSFCPSVAVPDRLLDPTDPASMRAAPEFAGANFAVRADAMALVGDFDVHLGAGAEFPGGEDTDYRMRLFDAGLPVVSSSRAVVCHTYGHRYGSRAAFRHHRNYVRGHGAIAAKRAMAGFDVSDWVRAEQLAPVRAAARMRPGAAARAAVRTWYFLAAYRECRTRFAYDPGRQALTPRAGGAVRPSPASIPPLEA
jgi:glycosyltransferase involved in cell wall biosynthesis